MGCIQLLWAEREELPAPIQWQPSEKKENDADNA